MANFDAEKVYQFELRVPPDIITIWRLKDGEYELAERLYGNKKARLEVADGRGKVSMELAPLESVIWEVGR